MVDIVGTWLVNAMHITASVFINDDESGLHHDYECGLRSLRRMSPFPVTGTTLARTTPTLT